MLCLGKHPSRYISYGVFVMRKVPHQIKVMAYSVHPISAPCLHVHNDEHWLAENRCFDLSNKTAARCIRALLNPKLATCRDEKNLKYCCIEGKRKKNWLIDVVNLHLRNIPRIRKNKTKHRLLIKPRVSVDHWYVHLNNIEFLLVNYSELSTVPLEHFRSRRIFKQNDSMKIANTW